MKKSIITDDMETCFECGAPMQQIHHCIFGCRKKLADEDGLVIPVCMECHTKIHHEPEMWRKYQRIAQESYEKLYGHEAFMERYGKNYL